MTAWAKKPKKWIERDGRRSEDMEERQARVEEIKKGLEKKNTEINGERPIGKQKDQGRDERDHNVRNSRVMSCVFGRTQSCHAKQILYDLSNLVCLHELTLHIRVTHTEWPKPAISMLTLYGSIDMKQTRVLTVNRT